LRCFLGERVESVDNQEKTGFSWEKPLELSR
jgi:hypothetical protein